MLPITITFLCFISLASVFSFLRRDIYVGKSVNGRLRLFGQRSLDDASQKPALPPPPRPDGILVKNERKYSLPSLSSKVPRNPYINRSHDDDKTRSSITSLNKLGLGSPRPKSFHYGSDLNKLGKASRAPFNSTMESTGQKKWNAGQIFNQPTSNSKYQNVRAIIPWWMREEIDKNPHSLSAYTPWWVSRPITVNREWTLEDLQKESMIRGLDSSGTRTQLIERLNEALEKNSLSDDNFTEPNILPCDKTDFPACYPEVYERRPF